MSHARRRDRALVGSGPLAGLRQRLQALPDEAVRPGRAGAPALGLTPALGGARRPALRHEHRDDFLGLGGLYEEVIEAEAPREELVVLPLPLSRHPDAQRAPG